MPINVDGMTRGTFISALLAVCLSNLWLNPNAGAQGLPDERLGQRTAPLLLLSRLDVSRNLKLSEAQVLEAEKAISDFYYVRARSLKGKKGPAADAERKRIDQDQFVWLDTHLSEDQRSRLLQLDLQWEGPAALVTRPKVADALSLSPPQRETLRQAVGVRNAARAKAAFSRAEEDVLTEKTLATLSEPQLERWLAMMGQPLFSPSLTAKNSTKTESR